MTDSDSYGSDPGTGPLPHAGWYPSGNGWQRYWDGQQWTDHQAPMPVAGQMQAVQQGGPPSSNDNSLAILAHLGGAFFSIIVPLAIYLAKRDESPYLRHHSAEALNFQITVLLAFIVSAMLIFVLIGFLLIPIIAIGFWILTIVASIAASRGEWYRYPMTIRMVS